MRTIEYKVSYEKMISRIPGLFAYLERNEIGELTLHHGYDKNNGCYGRIVENIKLPSNVNLTVNGKELLKPNTVYTYRTLISYYYQYKEEQIEDKSFIRFIERGIGKIAVPSRIIGKNVPKFVYLSNVIEILNVLTKMKKQCQSNEKDEFMCCLCERYNDMGGDDFLNWINGQVNTIEDVGKEFYDYAVVENKMTLDFDVDLVSSYDDMGLLDCYIEEWKPYKIYLKDDKVFYDDKIYKVKVKEGKNEVYGKVFNINDWEEVTFDTTPVSINNSNNVTNNTVYTDSKLKGLRRLITYINDDGVGEYPEEGTDWLFYYRKGRVLNVTTLNDELGNIKNLSNETATDDDDGDKLAAYGDVITDIKANDDDKTITFTYQLGTHLTATYNDSKTDDDNNIIYSWKKFKFDESDTNNTQKVIYTETYTYEEGSDLDSLIKGEITIPTDETQTVNDGSDLDSLINEETPISDDESKKVDFNKYINGDYDYSLKFYKFEFITDVNEDYYYKQIGNDEIKIYSLRTNYTFDLTDKNDTFLPIKEENIFRKPYNLGITFAPNKDIKVNINRGSTNCFQKHIGFGEIKTMEDLMTYRNGSFFKTTST